MNAHPDDIKAFKAVYYNNTADETADPVALALEAVDRQRDERDTAKRLALAAAGQATEAAAELMRFAREGEAFDHSWDTDVILQLLDATKMAIEAMGEAGGEHSSIYGEIAGTLEGWA